MRVFRLWERSGHAPHRKNPELLSFYTHFIHAVKKKKKHFFLVNTYKAANPVERNHFLYWCSFKDTTKAPSHRTRLRATGQTRLDWKTGDRRQKTALRALTASSSSSLRSRIWLSASTKYLGLQAACSSYEWPRAIQGPGGHLRSGKKRQKKQKKDTRMSKSLNKQPESFRGETSTFPLVLTSASGDEC